MEGRTWPRSPLRGVCSSPGECLGVAVMQGGPSVLGGKGDILSPSHGGMGQWWEVGWGSGVDLFLHWELKPWGCLGRAGVLLG